MKKILKTINPTIRKGKRNDITVIANLATKIWKQTFAGMIPNGQVDAMFCEQYSEKGLGQQMDDDHLFFLFYSDLEPIGFLSVSIIDRKRDYVKLQKFYLLPEYHGRGTAKIFLDSLIDYLEQNRLGRKLQLNVNRSNTRAIKFYEKYGFETIEEVDIPYKEFMLNDYIMELSLAING